MTYLDLLYRFALIIYWMVGLNPNPERVGLFMVTLMLTTLAAMPRSTWGLVLLLLAGGRAD